MSSFSLQTAKTALSLPPLSSLDCAPFVNPFFHVVENDILLTYPVSLYIREDSGKIKWLGFIYAFLFTGRDGKRILEISYPLCFDRAHEWEIFEKLFKEVEELAPGLEASFLEYEGYQNITRRILNPLSGIAFGNLPDPQFLEFIKAQGFVQKDIKTCYELKWSPNPAEIPKVELYTISDFRLRKNQYLELLRTSNSFPQLFDTGYEITLPPPVTERFSFREEWIVFTRSEKERGCIRWFPQSLFDERMKREAKIVRLLFSTTSSSFVCKSIIETLNRINSSGMDRIQISDVPQDSQIESFVKDLGGSSAYETVAMVKHL